MRLTIERLREVLSYDPETGIFRWLVQRGRAGRGTRAGNASGKGYRQIEVDGERLYEHRLAWFYMTGKWPAKEIDHIDGHVAENSWSNLREATRSQNLGNSRARRSNKLGIKGVGFDSRKGKYRARIKSGGREKWLGYFDTADAAHAAYVAAAYLAFGEFARAA